MPEKLDTAKVPANVADIFEKAQTYVRRYFGDIEFSPQRGRIEVGDQRYVLVRASAMSVEFFDLVRGLYGDDEGELAGSVTRSLLGDLSHAMGLSDARVFAERMGVEDPIERLSAGPIHFAHAGWAFVHIHDESRPVAGDGFFFVYDHPYSFEADAWLKAGRHSERPVCVMNAGYSSGWCEASFDVPLVAVELTCRARGDEQCRFVMAPPDRISARVDEYLSAHPELAADRSFLHVPSFFERERTAEALLATEQHRRSFEEEINRRIGEAIPGGMIQADAEGIIVRFNSAALEFVGVSAEEAVGRSLASIDGAVLHESGEAARHSETPAFKALATGDVQPPMTLGFRRPSGELRWAVFRAAPLLDPMTKEVSGVIVTFFEITERKREEEERQRNEMEMLERQRLSSLGLLAGGIAHDFNNILVGVLGNASLLRDEIGGEGAHMERLDQIEEGAARAADLTAQLLAYAGIGRFESRVIDLSSMLDDAIKLARVSLPRSVRLEVDLEAGLPAVQGDPTQLRQIMVNLLSNAAEAVGEAGGRVTMGTGCREMSREDLSRCREHEKAEPGLFTYLRVQDDGVGMDAEVLAKLFDPFFTTKFTGRGLGLAATLGIVRSHRGALCVESALGRGATIEVFFPAVSSRPLPASKPPPPGVEKLSGLVLVADDEPAVLRLISRILETLGLEIVTAEDGVEALEIFAERAEALTAVVLDLTMPRMGGREALEEMRRERPDLPALIVSGYDIEETRSRLPFPEATEFLPKPFDSRALRRAMTVLIAEARGESPTEGDPS